jgi:allophanate hydrolase subunit 1
MVTEGIETHYIDVERVIKERVFCQKQIVLQYDERKIDEKKLADKLRDLRKYSAIAEDAVTKMKELADVI